MQHPDHSPVLPRLKKAQGQLEGIERMIKEGRYCIDILVQFRAAMAALRKIEATVFESHLNHCVKEAMTSNEPETARKKIAELTELLIRRTTL